MIVVDSNIIAYFLIQGEGSREAQKVYERDPEWAAPVLWRSELLSVLAKYIKDERLSLEESLKHLELAEELLRNRTYDVNSADVLSLVEQSGHHSYDCEYVTLARNLSCPLVTRDEMLQQAFGDKVCSPEVFLSG